MDTDKQRTIAYYDRKAEKLVEKYKGLMEFYRRSEFQQFIDFLPAREPAGDGFTRQYVLDIGCGGGDHAAYFTECGLGVECIDISPRMVEIAKSKGLDACVMDIENMKFGPEQFHGGWAVTSFPHIPKARMPQVVDKLHEILKQDGILYACVKQGDGEGLIADKDDPDTPRFFAFYRDEEFRELFKNRFTLLDFRQPVVGETTFLQYFFKKR